MDVFAFHISGETHLNGSLLTMLKRLPMIKLLMTTIKLPMTMKNGLNERDRKHGVYSSFNGYSS